MNEADRLDLIDPERLAQTSSTIGENPVRPGSARCSTAGPSASRPPSWSAVSCPIAGAAGLPPPLTNRTVNDFKVDFFWPELGLVVETDGLRYHRTPAQQARDRLRDQAHLAAGLTPLRFTHAQVLRYEPAHVRATLVAVSRCSRLE